MKKSGLRDTGDRRKFQTGAVRDVTTLKGAYHLLSPIAKRRLAIHSQKGAIKYSDRNWEKGIPLSSFFDSAQRHMDDYLEGKDDEDHLAAAFWNIQGLIHTEEMIRRRLLPKKLNDLPCYIKGKGRD